MAGCWIAGAGCLAPLLVLSAPCLLSRLAGLGLAGGLLVCGVLGPPLLTACAAYAPRLPGDLRDTRMAIAAGLAVAVIGAGVPRGISFARPPEWDLALALLLQAATAGAYVSMVAAHRQLGNEVGAPLLILLAFTCGCPLLWPPALVVLLAAGILTLGLIERDLRSRSRARARLAAVFD